LIAHEMITEEELLEAIVLLSHMDPLSEVAKQEARG